MNSSKMSNIIATGLAMFSMFFGAGNIVFPLSLGQEAQHMNVFAIFGLLITAVCVPFIGLLSMTLFDGDYRKFFGKIGKSAGFILALFIISLIGPFGAIPRCITLSYSTMKLFVPSISLPIFSVISCLIILALTYQRKNLIDILGYILTPILLLSLGLIIVVGLFSPATLHLSDLTATDAFLKGMIEGYQTMDLLGAFFFSSVVILCLKKELPYGETPDYKQILILVLKASAIGASLLALTYIGFSFVAAFHSHTLGDISKDQLISKIAVDLMGPHAGLIACVAVALTCLTTAIALSVVFAEYLHDDITLKNVSYKTCLIVTLMITYFFSTLEFTGIAKILVPILQVCYPALIVLSIANIFNKLYGFKRIKESFFVTLVASLAYYYFL